MPSRFLIAMPDAAGPTTGARVVLDPQRSNYVCKVMRSRIGDVLHCFDGKGTAFTATVTKADGKRCEITVAEVSATTSLPTFPLHLGIGLIKGPAMDRALQQATELGVAEITLISAQRSNVHLDRTRAANKMSHWRKVIEAACEQCGRLFTPALNELVSVEQMLARAAQPVMVLDQSGEPLPKQMPRAARLILIGPEGGWDDGERAVFEQSGVSIYRVAANTLRAETVPAIALALLQHIQD